jgi:hypothetical protein
MRRIFLDFLVKKAWITIAEDRVKISLAYSVPASSLLAQPHGLSVPSGCASLSPAIFFELSKRSLRPQPNDT